MSSQQPDTAEHPVATTAAVATVAAGVGGLVAVNGIRRIYVAATIRALTLLRMAVNRTLANPGDQNDRFTTRWRLDRHMMALVGQLEEQARTEIHAAVTQAQQDGIDLARRDLPEPEPEPPSAPSAPVTVTPRQPDRPDQLEVAFRASEVRVAHQQLVQQVDSIYRQVVDKALGEETTRVSRVRVAQRALDEFAGRGISVFRDKAGREWSIDAYVEMATRTVVANAQRDAYLQRAVAAGATHVRISVSPTCCPLCKPYDGKLIAIEDLAAAKAAGLFHPNCRHTFTIAKAGQKLPPSPKPDMDRYRAEQRLRYLERRVRAARRREAVALDPKAKRKARADLVAAWAAIRDHIDDTGIRRNRQREQIIRARG